MSRWKVRIKFATEMDPMPKYATIILDAASERGVRRQLAEMGVASEIVPPRIGMDAMRGLEGEPILSDDIAELVQTESIGPLYDDWARTIPPRQPSRSVRAVLATRKWLHERRK